MRLRCRAARFRPINSHFETYDHLTTPLCGLSGDPKGEPVPIADPAGLPAQLISYHMSMARGIDPDRPRNLSKTLTMN